MRVLQVHNYYREYSGENSVVHAEADLLRAAGHEVVECRTTNPGSLVRGAASFAAAPWNPLSASWLRGQVADARPEVAHIHNTWFSFSPSVLSAIHRAGVPVVMTLHNYRLTCGNALLFRDGRPCELCVGTHPWHAVVHKCYRGSRSQSIVAAATITLNRMLATWDRHVDLFLPLNEFGAELFARAGVPARKLRVKPNFVVDPGPRALPAAESDMVLYVGSIDPRKGLGRLLDAWERSAPPGLRLVLLGDGPSREHLERSAPASVRFEGFVTPDAVGAWMSRARALVHPATAYEGQPMALLEAMAAGLPVLSSNMGPLVEMLGEAATGWSFDPFDPGSFAAPFARLRDPEAIASSSELVRRRYEERFSPGPGLANLEAAYADAIGRRARSAEPASSQGGDG